MHAKKGDHIVIPGHTVGARIREAEVLGVRGTAGAPPYEVRWLDDGHVSIFTPGPDAYVQRSAKARA